MQLPAEKIEEKKVFRKFVNSKITPRAGQFDQEERIPRTLIDELAERGYLAGTVPKKYGGKEMDAISFGLLNEEVGRGCSSVRSLLTVQNMVAQAILKCGNTEQRAKWLQRLVTGETIAGFGLTEPGVGSDAKSIEMVADIHEGNCSLNGQKKWVSFGQIADIFLVFAQSAGEPTAFLIEREAKGITVQPTGGLLGTRASMGASVSLEDCSIPRVNMVGGPGLGLVVVAATALDLGRYSVAWGAVGIIQACLDACLEYTTRRKQFGVQLKEHQLIQQMITNMLTNVKAARLLCYNAGLLRNQHDPRSVMDTWIAKYFATQAAMQAGNDAVQIHGANGCGPDYPVQRYMRDAKIMEIIEGSTQIHQIMIAEYGYQEHSTNLSDENEAPSWQEQSV